MTLQHIAPYMAWRTHLRAWCMCPPVAAVPGVQVLVRLWPERVRARASGACNLLPEPPCCPDLCCCCISWPPMWALMAGLPASSGVEASFV